MSNFTIKALTSETFGDFAAFVPITARLVGGMRSRMSGERRRNGGRDE